ncbi:AAA domain-containing protein [bacterium]|nr:AAA domain-containing protein [bacterium]
MLACAGVISIIYCLQVIVVVATTPDLRLRWLMVDPPVVVPGNDAPVSAIKIHQVNGLETRGPRPEPGDYLLTLDEQPVGISIDAASCLLNSIPSRWTHWESPWSSETDRSSPEWMPVTYWSARDQQTYRTQVALQTVAEQELGVTLVWLICQLGIFGLSTLAFWKRPFDRPARLFFAMCIVTLAAFVGGFHWWLLAGRLLLICPFVICALLLPSVTLHFFLAYPQPKQVITQWYRATLWGLYGPPILAAIGFLIIELLLWSGTGPGRSNEQTFAAVGWLNVMRWGIYGYFAIAAGYFALILVSLLHSVLTVRPVLERRQVTSILWAAMVASVFIGYTLILAGWDRVSFALGGARLPMFFSSLVFMVAYAVGIVRYKLMLGDEWLGRGLIAEGLRWAGALALGALTVPIALELGRRTEGLPFLSTIAVGMILLVVLTVVMNVRDFGLSWLERYLFRDRYRMEKALQRIHRAVGQLADPQFLSKRTMVACVEVLQAEWAALYLRDPQRAEVFRMNVIEGATIDLPIEWSPPDGFLEALEQQSGLFGLYEERRSETAILQQGLHDLRANLVQLLEIDGDIAGLVILGPKQSGGMYRPEDATFLTALTQLTGVALHCVRVHQDLTQLNEQLRLKVERIALQRQQIVALQAELAATRPVAALTNESEFQRAAIKGNGAALTQVLNMARKAAISETTVLIRGESGTGKELLARAIHDNSPRKTGPFIAVHCAALAPSLLESELFGHIKGAFTGASSDKQGRIELASGGTLFLDEIGELSPEIQVKLLRVLQQREIEPVGASKAVAVDIRLVAATHRDLESMIADGQFREDLYYRLNVITLSLPSLRERRDDLHELAREFLRRAVEKADKAIIAFDDEALNALLQYDWPGNIRELENVIERAVVLAEGDLITVQDLPPDISQLTTVAMGRSSNRAGRATQPRPPRGRQSAAPALSWRRMETDDERRLLLDALHQAQGNKAQAAKSLGLPRSTFFSKLKKHAILDQDWSN